MREIYLLEVPEDECNDNSSAFHGYKTDISEKTGYRQYWKIIRKATKQERVACFQNQITNREYKIKVLRGEIKVLRDELEDIKQEV